MLPAAAGATGAVLCTKCETVYNTKRSTNALVILLYHYMNKMCAREHATKQHCSLPKISKPLYTTNRL
jgi:hypothetical protein